MKSKVKSIDERSLWNKKKASRVGLSNTKIQLKKNVFSAVRKNIFLNIETKILLENVAFKLMLVDKNKWKNW